MIILRDPVDPITFFTTKSGICVDYALFTVTALLAGGAKEAYVVLFDTKQGSHAAAGIKINNVLYMLDQKLPVYEWADYVEYVLYPVGNYMQVIKVWLDYLGNSAIEVFTVNPNTFRLSNPDTYPTDRAPKSLIEDALDIVRRNKQAVFPPQCSWSFYIITFDLSWQPLKAYTPVFHKNFAELLAKVILEQLTSFTYTCLYYHVEGDTLVLYLS